VLTTIEGLKTTDEELMNKTEDLKKDNEDLQRQIEESTEMLRTHISQIYVYAVAIGVISAVVTGVIIYLVLQRKG
ncbi:MAG: hypothetical protein NWE75_03855, partial [Candidatus Bathyarchaeota archaeon]|nr:hypothetical protein [Candidatus Bathyarchaeota archaeon]